jgi:spermidine/putrescine transport system permease protein
MVEKRSIIGRALMTLAIGTSYLFVYLPIVVLVLFSFSSSQFEIQWSGFSLQWYQKLITSPEILRALSNSLIVAVSSSILSVILGLGIVLASSWLRPRLLFSIFYPNLVLPDIVLAIGILSIFSFLSMPLGYGSLIVGHTLISLGFVIPVIYSRFSEIDPVLTEASLDLGATTMQTLRNIVLPLLTPALIAGGLIAFTLSLDDFLIAYFCSGPTIDTLSTYVFSCVRTTLDPTINALSTCMLVASSLLVLALSAFNIFDGGSSSE